MNENVLVRLKGVAKSFDGEPVLRSIDLDIHDKEFVTLLGPSGCGKTTTLRIIGGFVSPDCGDVEFGGQRINDVPVHKRSHTESIHRHKTETNEAAPATPSARVGGSSLCKSPESILPPSKPPTGIRLNTPSDRLAKASWLRSSARSMNGRSRANERKLTKGPARHSATSAG